MPATSPAVRATEQGTIVEIYVQPRASRSELAGMHEGRLKVRLTAPPVEGEANRECVRFLAKLLDIPRSSVSVLQGLKSRSKTLLIRGLTPEDVIRKLEQSPFPPGHFV
jgi:uncharacterized protein (TIGR00251 family)